MPEPPPAPSTASGLALKLVVYALFAVGGLLVFPGVLSAFGVLIMAALGTFAAAAVANAMTLRIFERATLPDIGLGWPRGSARNLLLGIGGGVVAAALVLLPPLAAGAASLVPDPEHPADAGSLLFVSVLLLFGAVGEELLFRGYAFQLLAGRIGAFATILPSALIFALLHANNQNASTLGLINTGGFGVVLGYAMIRSGDLWLPIGIHIGWNWALPLAGVNLSGFTMGLTGYAIRWNVGELWSGGGYGPEASILTSGVIVALLYYVHRAPVVTQAPLLLRPRPEA